ncbi:hypothetical protein AMECASPLE_027593 [Ameca splendens]|uniref:Small monomeric GTPase n=1 Tax=Ameca splendens TaxID=208324 RepID=A0ABV0YGD9_9TELE
MPLPKSRKIAVLGYRSVGKSSLTIQFVEGQFVDSYDPTIENTFTKTMTVNGQEYNLQLVDTAGQDEYSIFPESYTIDVNGYVLIYSVTSYKRGLGEEDGCRDDEEQRSFMCLFPSTSKS